MDLGRTIAILNGEVLTSPVRMDMEMTAGFGADLVSDMVAAAKPGALMLTGLCNLQTIHTAGILDVAAVVFVSGKRPLDDVLAAAQRDDLPLICTTFSMFEACGRLYQAGLAPSLAGQPDSNCRPTKAHVLDLGE